MDAEGRHLGCWPALLLLDSLMDAVAVESIGGPLASSWWHKIGTALGECGPSTSFPSKQR